MKLNNTHQKTLRAIFELPIRADIKWDAIEKLFIALGASVTEGSGSRVRVLLNDEVAIFHRPHRLPDTDKGAVKSARNFLLNAGCAPSDLEPVDQVDRGESQEVRS